MTHNNIKLGPGQLFFHTPDEPQPKPLYVLEDAPDIEAAEPIEWPKENPYIIPNPPEATFTATLQVSEPLRRAGEAFSRCATALADFIRAMVEFAASVLSAEQIQAALKAAKVNEALAEAPPRVRHLALHGKKYRTQKKNTARALREYQRRRNA